MNKSWWSQAILPECTFLQYKNTRQVIERLVSAGQNTYSFGLSEIINIKHLVQYLIHRKHSVNVSYHYYGALNILTMLAAWAFDLHPCSNTHYLCVNGKVT